MCYRTYGFYVKKLSILSADQRALEKTNMKIDVSKMDV